MYRPCWPASAVALLLLMTPAGQGAEAKPPADAKAFDTTLRPFVKRYCFDCHSGPGAESGVRLDKYQTAASVSQDPALWQRVLRALRGGRMPPEDSPRATGAETKAVMAWLDATLGQGNGQSAPQPGRVTIRRLNRVEYANTIRDLLGVEFNAAGDFPADDVGYGFDNIGDVLTLSPLLMEKYLAAAEQITAKAVAAERAEKSGGQATDAGGPPRRIFFVRPNDRLPAHEAARQILRKLAGRAYRRPATDAELDRLMTLVEQSQRQGGSFETSIGLALQAVLVSPHFLFRVELDAAPDAPQVRALNDYELAARLSYFLWSSMPDDELFEQAARGTLRADLHREVRRMLADPKTRALVENFAGQWLQWRNLDAARPDAKQFPAFDDDLRRAMRTEAQMCFETMLREDRNVLELVDTDYTFVNARLARHYGLPGIEGEQFRRVSLSGPGVPEAARVRGGVITHASMLTVTSNPTRTSPVKRGRWILDNILGTPPADPPPNVPALKDDAQAALSGTLRQRMEQHRKDPVCAVCHKEMDAMGFALENFDAIGAWRTRDGEFPIDASGQLPGGQAFNGPSQLKAVLLTTGKEKFVRCLTEKLLTYALGRGLEPYDRSTVERITKDLAAADYKFSALVLGIVHSEPFQKRQGRG